MLADVKHPSVATDRQLDQGPEGRAVEAGAVGATRLQAKVANDMRARCIDEVHRLTVGGNP